MFGTRASLVQPTSWMSTFAICVTRSAIRSRSSFAPSEVSVTSLPLRNRHEDAVHSVPADGVVCGLARSTPHPIWRFHLFHSGEIPRKKSERHAGQRGADDR